MNYFTAIIRDCSGKKPTPEFDIYIPADIANNYRLEDGEQVELVLDNAGPWRGTIGRNPPNRVYLHRRWSRGNEELSLAEHLRQAGYSHGARIRMGIEVTSCVRLHLP